MKYLRETIRKLILESDQDARYKKLLSLLDSYDLANVQQGIELAVTLGLAKVIRHRAVKGGVRGFRGVQHVFDLQLTQPFMEFFYRVFDANRGMSPNRHIFLGFEDYSFRNLAPRTITVSAEDENETVMDVFEEWNDRSVREIDLPI